MIDTKDIGSIASLQRQPVSQVQLLSLSALEGDTVEEGSTGRLVPAEAQELVSAQVNLHHVIGEARIVNVNDVVASQFYRSELVCDRQGGAYVAGDNLSGGSLDGNNPHWLGGNQAARHGEDNNEKGMVKNGYSVVVLSTMEVKWTVVSMN